MPVVIIISRDFIAHYKGFNKRMRANNGNGERKNDDIRNYFSRRSRRIGNADEQKLVISQTEKTAPSSPLAIVRHPLYAAPPRLGDLVSSEGDNSVGEQCADFQDYLNKSASSSTVSESEQTEYERSRLIAFLVKNGIAWVIPTDMSSLECRLIRKLLEREQRKHEEPLEILITWLASASFCAGLQTLTKVLRSHRVHTAPEGAWYLLMVIEPAVRAEPLLQTDPVLSTLLVEQERLILQSTAWQADYPLYHLLSQEERINKRPRTRRESLGSPRKGSAFHDQC